MAKNGRPFKYSRKDGSLDIERIEAIIEEYFANKDAAARKKAYKKLTKEEQAKTTIEDMTEQGIYRITGICVALGIERNTLSLWESGLTSDPVYDEQGNDVSKYNNELSTVVKKAKTKVYECMEEDRDNKTPMNIFLLKNHAGYADKQEQTVEFTGSLTVNLGDLDKFSK